MSEDKVRLRGWASKEPKPNPSFSYLKSSHQAMRGTAANPLDEGKVLDALADSSRDLRYHNLAGLAITPDGSIPAHGAKFSYQGFGRLCTSLGVPRRLVEDYSSFAPEKATQLLNDYIARKAKDKRIVVTGSNVIEGVVTEDYNRLPNVDVARQVFSLAKQQGSIVSMFKLEGLRMRLTTAHYDNPQEMQRGDILHTGTEVMNGEDGGTSFDVAGYIFRLICSNGMIGHKKETLGHLTHRSASIETRAAQAMIRASQSSAAYLPLIKASVNMSFDGKAQKEFIELTKERFSHAFTNGVLVSAAEEATKWNHDPIRVYDVWNGITQMAHESPNLSHEREVQIYAADFLKKMVKAA